MEWMTFYFLLYVLFFIVPLAVGFMMRLAIMKLVIDGLRSYLWSMHDRY